MTAVVDMQKTNNQQKNLPILNHKCFEIQKTKGLPKTKTGGNDTPIKNLICNEIPIFSEKYSESDQKNQVKLISWKRLA